MGSRLIGKGRGFPVDLHMGSMGTVSGSYLSMSYGWGPLGLSHVLWMGVLSADVLCMGAL